MFFFRCYCCCFFAASFFYHVWFAATEVQEMHGQNIIIQNNNIDPAMKARVVATKQQLSALEIVIMQHSHTKWAAQCILQYCSLFSRGILIWMHFFLLCIKKRMPFKKTQKCLSYERFVYITAQLFFAKYIKIDVCVCETLCAE